VDTTFYGKQFFPKTLRQDTPLFHRNFWEGFEDNSIDLFGAEIFRGGGKTTLTRVGISKRIAFGISRNILAIAISEAMAIHTIRWLKKQVEQNQYWTSTFELQRGTKWTDEWIEIQHGPMGFTINILAKGMTSGLRGLNLDDYRPDFIFCDDISNEETVGTPEQRTKNRELFFGALVPSLAPKSEAPMRKLVLAQTSLHKEDIISLAHKDPAFRTVCYPKLVEKSDGVQESAWESRFPLAQVLQEKEEYTKRKQLHTWLKEYGCKIVSRETAPLDSLQLQYWKALPTNLLYFIGLDPAVSKKRQAHRTAAAVVGLQPQTGDIYLLTHFAQVGKMPDEMWNWLVQQYRQYRPRKIGAETIGFQKFLKWYFETKMLETRTFFAVEEVEDRRSKPDRIIQAFSGLASQGKLWVNENHTDFVQGYTEWTEDVDWDLGDAVAQAITLANPWLAMADGSVLNDEDYPMEDEKDIPDITYEGGCP
jgi:hypothetical protein